MTDNILMLAAAATTFVRVLIDLVKLSPLPTTGRIPAILAVPVGILVVLIMMVGNGAEINAQAAANAGLAGILAAGAALGVTELGRRAG